jgi:C1A family cysteine protease
MLSAALCCVLMSMTANAVKLGTANDTDLFEQFKQQYNKKYASCVEEQERKTIFDENLRKIKFQQAGNPHAIFGINKFSDMTPEEFKIYHNAENYYSQFESLLDLKSVPFLQGNRSIDWVNHGVVTPVKNQGQCGSCWSFSTTGNIEGQWALAGNNLISLSEQELVSCSTNNDGCNGGMMDNAFVWLLRTKNGWITSEDSCPYVSGDGSVPQCNYLRTSLRAAKITGYLNLPHDEKDMADWLYQHGPVSIGVDASSWQYYTGGIMTNCESTQVDHGVLLVGFDEKHNPPYWIIKNSWGPDWGESGYIRVEMGTNQCLITTAPCSSKV